MPREIIFKDDLGTPHVFVPKHNLHRLGDEKLQRRIIRNIIKRGEGIEVSRISGVGGDIVERIVHTRKGDLTIRLFEYAGGRIVVNTAFIK